MPVIYIAICRASICRGNYRACGWDGSPQYLIRDRDRVYGEAFTRRLRVMGIRDRPIAPRDAKAGRASGTRIASCIHETNQDMFSCLPSSWVSAARLRGSPIVTKEWTWSGPKLHRLPNDCLPQLPTGLRLFRLQVLQKPRGSSYQSGFSSCRPAAYAHCSCRRCRNPAAA